MTETRPKLNSMQVGFHAAARVKVETGRGPTRAWMEILAYDEDGDYMGSVTIHAPVGQVFEVANQTITSKPWAEVEA